MRQSTTAEVRPDEGKAASSDAERPSDSPFSLPSGGLRFEFRCDPPRSDGRSCSTAWGIRGMSAKEEFAMSRILLCAAVAWGLAMAVFAPHPGSAATNISGQTNSATLPSGALAQLSPTCNLRLWGVSVGRLAGVLL